MDAEKFGSVTDLQSYLFNLVKEIGDLLALSVRLNHFYQGWFEIIDQ